MSLYEIIDDMARKTVTKTETGDNRIFGVAVGVVAKNYHKDMPGRLCVSISVRDKDANELKWARLAMPFSGKGWGCYFMPEVGDQVLLIFEGGNIEKPFIIGSVPKDDNPFLTQSADEKNQNKRIVTRNGSTILFEDNRDGDGDKDKITIQTAKKKHTIQMDNENKKILLKDEKGDNQIEMMTEAGQMNITAQSKLTIKVGDSIKITLNGETGAIKIKANELSAETSQQLKLQTDGTASLKGAQLTLAGSSMVKAESSGIIKISGSPVNLG